MERLFIGGLSKECPEEALSALLSKYGTISRLHMPEAVIGGNRGYAFADINFTTPADRNKLLSLVNGSVWRGHKIKVERASEVPFEQRKPHDIASLTASKKRRRLLVRHADGPMDLVTDRNVDSKRRDWWYRGKYGRPVAVMRLRRPDGTMMTVDPAHHKDRFEKLFGSVRPKPVSALMWSMETACGDIVCASVKDCNTVCDSGSEQDHSIGGDNESSATSGEHRETIMEQKSVEKHVDNRLVALFANLTDIQPQGTFYRDQPLEEVRFEWVKQRSELRQDFRRRFKQAKRVIKKRQKLQ